MSKKIIFSAIILIFITSATPTHRASAVVAWPDLGNAFFRTMLDGMWEQIKAAIIGALKKAAIETISDTVNNLISGTSQAASLFITDWEDYLFNSPTGSTNSYINDFFTVTTRGKSSGSYSSGACGGSYSEWRSARAKDYVVTIDYTSLQDTFEEWACGPVEMFNDGTWAAYNAFMEPKNNPLAYALITESVYEKKLAQEKEKAALQAQSYAGFTAQKTKEGVVITPGSVLEGITVAANTMDNDAIANARNAGEIAGIVVGKIATGIIKNGIGKARQNVQNKINDSICDASQELRNALKGLTPSGHLLQGGGSNLGTMGRSSASQCNLK
ncbi:MAG: hypothetical protein ACD_7C00297G0003 [uncultured bacterium]|nr:MAG: hypothetical protein ACD_7C00297G0003 [uncultured bacterium]HBR79170.1 hypothetical protein [Candidatus Moranbacteria bacterium]